MWPFSLFRKKKEEPIYTQPVDIPEETEEILIPRAVQYLKDHPEWGPRWQRRKIILAMQKRLKIIHANKER